jgi:hypothetical protein
MVQPELNRPVAADEPGVLRNSTSSPLHLLFIATADERGAEIALRIAGHLLRDLR